MMQKETNQRILSILAGAMMVGSSLCFLLVTGPWLTQEPPSTFKGYYSYMASVNESVEGRPLPFVTNVALRMAKSDSFKYGLLVVTIAVMVIGEVAVKERIHAVSLYSFLGMSIFAVAVFTLSSLMLPYCKIIM